jgi:hypothetical protein
MAHARAAALARSDGPQTMLHSLHGQVGRCGRLLHAPFSKRQPLQLVFRCLRAFVTASIVTSRNKQRHTGSGKAPRALSPVRRMCSRALATGATSVWALQHRVPSAMPPLQRSACVCSKRLRRPTCGVVRTMCASQKMLGMCSYNSASAACLRAHARTPPADPSPHPCLRAFPHLMLAMTAVLPAAHLKRAATGTCRSRRACLRLRPFDAMLHLLLRLAQPARARTPLYSTHGIGTHQVCP